MAKKKLKAHSDQARWEGLPTQRPRKASHRRTEISGQAGRKILSLPATTSTLPHPATRITHKMG
jgi:hypothetical protein